MSEHVASSSKLAPNRTVEIGQSPRCSLTLLDDGSTNESSVPPQVVTILASAAEAPDGTYPFGGVMTGPNGEYLATVRGRLPRGFFDIKPARRRGRPKDEPRKVAIRLHECLVQTLHHRYGKPLRKTRAEASRAMGFNFQDDGEAEKYIRDHSKHPTVATALADYCGVLMFAGDGEGDGRLALLIRRDADVRWVGSGLKVSGRVWICQWGDSSAGHGVVDCVIPVSDARHDAAAHVARVMARADP